MKAMIFAAGLGTRLKPLTDNMPKALVSVNNRPLLAHTIQYLKAAGIENVVVNVHHFADQIEKSLHENDGWGSKYVISDERNAVLETGGGLKKAAPFFIEESCFVLINVDIMTNLDLAKMIEHHQKSGSAATLAVMKRKSSRYLQFNENNELTGWINATTGETKTARPDRQVMQLAFSGISVLSGALLHDIPFEGKFSIIDLFLYWATKHKISAYDHTGDVFLDVGRPETIATAGVLFP